MIDLSLQRSPALHGPRTRVARLGGGLVCAGFYATLLLACGDDEATFAPRPGRADSGSAGKDAGELKDAAGSYDAGDEDDASVVVDACTEAAKQGEFSADVPFSGEGGYSLTMGTAGFGVAYLAEDAGCRSIWTLPVLALGAIEGPKKVLSDCKTITDLTLLRVSAGWQLVWVDNADDSAEVQSTLLGEDLATPVGALRTRLTTNELHEQHPVLADVSGAPFVAFVATDPSTRKARVLGQRLDGRSELHELVPEDAGRRPIRLALTQIGAGNALLAWIDEAAETRGIWLQRLDLLGKTVEAPVQLSAFSASGSTVDFATRPPGEGGAVVYSVNVGGDNREVRFRRLSPTGELVGTEIKVVGAPLQARDASIARVGGGYCVAYRALPTAAGEQSQIRMTTISKDGVLTRDASGGLVSYPVADASADAGRVTIRLSNDGVLLVGFVDGSEDAKTIRLVRKRLDCAL
jgi:hypothetical protein